MPGQQLRFRGFAAAILGNASSRTVFHHILMLNELSSAVIPYFPNMG